MRTILLSSAIVLSLIGGASAMAATKAAPAAKPAATMSKHSSCAMQWKAETSHTQSHKAFMAACEKA